MWMFLLGSSLDACSLCPFIRLDIQSPKPRNHNAKERFHTLKQLEHQFPVKMTATRRDESHKDESDILDTNALLRQTVAGTLLLELLTGLVTCPSSNPAAEIYERISRSSQSSTIEPLDRPIWLQMMPHV